MAQVRLDTRPLLEPERLRAFAGSDLEQVGDWDDVSPQLLAACDPLELAELLQRIEAHVRVGADAERDPMRILTERMKGKKVDTLDGIKIFEERGWAQVLPDPDEPLVHVYAEGNTAEDAAALEEEFLKLVEEIVAGAEDDVEPERA